MHGLWSWPHRCVLRCTSIVKWKVTEKWLPTPWHDVGGGDAGSFTFCNVCAWKRVFRYLLCITYPFILFSREPTSTTKSEANSTLQAEPTPGPDAVLLLSVCCLLSWRWCHMRPISPLPPAPAYSRLSLTRSSSLGSLSRAPFAAPNNY